MNRDIAKDFFLDPALTYFNHASYGAPTRQLMRSVEQARASLERDTAVSLGPALYPRLARSADCLANVLGISSGSIAMVANATSANAALASTLLPRRPIRVVMFDLEYSSIIRAWQRRVDESGGSLEVIPVDIPVRDANQLLTLLASVPGDVDVLVVSETTSSSALRLPVTDIMRWARNRGAQVVLDAAQGGFQSALRIADLGVDAVFASVHKWLPVPRPVGYLWVADHLDADVRPAEVSLNWDDGEFVRRFGWRGTWDPAPALCLPEAIESWQGWVQDGLWEDALRIADLASRALEDMGFVPTGPRNLQPQLMRAFIAPAIEARTLKETLMAAGVRASVGKAGAQTIVRISAHVYNSEDDVAALLHCLSGYSKRVQNG